MRTELGLGKKQDRLWNSATKSKLPIKLHKTIKDHLPLWRDNPESVLGFESSSHATTSDYALSLYRCTTRLKSQETLLPVQLRLVYVAFYRLKEHLGLDFRILAKYLCDICTLTSEDMDDLAEVTRSMAKWARKGAQYDSVAARLGGTDTLLVLPEDISPTV